MVVLLTPIGYSPTGEMLNLLSEDVAMQAAIALSADKLIYLHGDAASISKNLRELSATDQRDSSGLIAENSESIRDIIERSKSACQHGVNRCHIVDTNSVNGIMALIKPLMDDGTLAQRTEQDLEREIQNFYIIEREGSVICSASLQTYGDIAELGCLAVHPDFRASGKASDMLNHLVKEARHKRCKKIFSLSTRTGDWFIEQGFKEDNAASIPQSRQIEKSRGSKLYTLNL